MNSHLNIKEVFLSLSPPSEITATDTQIYCAKPISEEGNIQIGKNHEGKPVLLLPTTKSKWSGRREEYKHISIFHEISITLTNPDRESNNQFVFTVMECLSDMLEIQDSFLTFIQVVIDHHYSQSKNLDIQSIINSIIKLFESVTKPATRTITGLWGELFLIATATNPVPLCKSWHRSPSDTFDFAIRDERIEVKTTRKQNRIHNFSIDQLNYPENLSVFVVSIQLIESDWGKSISDLISDIEQNIDSELSQKVWDIAISTLGNDWFRGNYLKFDPANAKSSIFVQDALDIPKIDNNNIPDGVSDVRFKSDISLSGPSILNTVNSQLLGYYK